jgi:23S rRNA G2445 N2-methylase RlmL
MLLDALRLVGPPGSNKVMAGELSRLVRRGLPGYRLPEPRKAGNGALIYPFEAAVAHLAVWYARTPSRVLWDLYESNAARLEPLHEEVARDAAADTRAWLWDGASLSIRARNLGGFAAGELQVVGTIKNALIAGAAARGVRLRLDPERPDILFAVRMHDDALTVSIDLAGQAMHQRGYRRAAGAAPLRENLAAALVMLARYDARREILVDPLAGSGTIAIEAALMGRGEPLWRGAPPAAHRLPAFAGWPVRDEALFADTEPLAIANEIDTPTVAAARENIAAAGMSERVVSLHGDFRQLTAERIARIARERGRAGQGGVILSNPPYGSRLEKAGDVEALYRDLGAWCRRFPGWRAAFLVAHPGFERAFGGRPRIVKPLPNANQPARFYLYDIGPADAL